jgi:flagellar hook-length control protein FliK
MIDENAADANGRIQVPPPKTDSAAKPADKQAKSKDSGANKTAGTDKASGDTASKDTSENKDTSNDKSADAATGMAAKGDAGKNKTAVAAVSTDKGQADPVGVQTQEPAPPVAAKKPADGKAAAKSAEQAAAGAAATSSGETKVAGKPGDKSKSDKKGDGDAATGDPAPAAGTATAVAAPVTAVAAPVTAATVPPPTDAATAMKSAPIQAVVTLVAGVAKPTAKNNAKVADKATMPADKPADTPAAGATASGQIAAPASKDAGPQPPDPESAKKADAQVRNATPAHAQKAPGFAGAPQADTKNSAPNPDAAQAPTFPAPLQQAAAPSSPSPAAPSTPQPAAQPAAVPLAGIAVAIAAKAFAGKNHFAIRLDPPELGRIEVHLDVDKDGRVTSHLVADRGDTLNLLQRDSSALQRALQNAGLKTSDNGLQFSLRDQSGYPQQDRSTSNSAHIVIEDDTLPAIKAVQIAQRFAARRGGIDIRI